VSETVATILLLGMTITLFSSIFVFTSRNPTAQPQALNEFTAALSYGGSGGLQVLTISITHLSGNVITGAATTQAAVYVTSQKHPVAIPSPFSLSAGLSGSSIWGFSQTWSVSLSTYSITSPDNLTVSVISHDQLQYHTVLFALVPTNYPYFLKVQTTPVSVAPNAAFNLSSIVQFASSLGDNVKVNLTAIGGSANQAMTGSGGTGLYYYDGTAPNPAMAKTYYLVLTATDMNGLRTSFAVPLMVT
jgi:hypothetical protein